MWNRESRENIMIVGHRGIRNLYPENTMVSFRAALELRLDLIEFDVHFTKDKTLVVCHDGTIDRTTNGTGKIRDMTLQQLQSYDAGIVMGERFAGQYIPTLEEVLELMANADYEVLLNVEIKDYDHEVVDATIAMLKRFGLDQRTVIACFNAEVIAYTQKAHPDMRTQGFPERVMRKNTDAEFEITQELYDKMFGIGIPLGDDVDVAREDVAFANAHGLRPWLFCMDNEERTRIAVEIGATNVTCNDPTDTMNRVMLAPSVMCVSEWKDSENVLRALEDGGVDVLHVDVMDGEFVANLMLGTESIRHLRKASSIPLDIHLMIQRPEDKLDWFDIQPGEYVSVHAESTRHLQRALAKIRSYGAHPIVALNPATPLYMVEDVLEDVDGVLLMTVNPGFAGQKLVPQTLDKISRLRTMLDEAGRGHVLIEVDGNVSFVNGEKMRRAGADMFVCGSSSIFSKEGTVEENIARFRNCVGD